MRKKIRLALVGGTSQSLFLASALRARDEELSNEEWYNILLLYGRHSGEYKYVLEAFTKLCYPWDSVIWADDVLVQYLPTRRFFPIARDIIRARVGRKVDEIWVEELYKDPAKILLSTYTRADLCLYEDGVGSYANIPFCCGREWYASGNTSLLGYLRRQVSHYLGVSECMEMVGYCDRNLRRNSKAYYFLAENMPRPPYLSKVMSIRHVEKRFMINEIGRIRKKLGESCHVELLPNSVIVIGEAISVQKNCDYEAEVAFYVRIISDLCRAGLNVYWKDHPRHPSRFSDLQSALAVDKAVCFLDCAQWLPIEVLEYSVPPVGFVANCGTGLFTMKYILEMNTFTCYEYHKDILGIRLPESYEKMIEENRIPPVSSL